MTEPCGCGVHRTYERNGERVDERQFISCTDPAHIAAAAAGREMRAALEAVGCRGQYLCKMMQGNPYHRGDCVVCAALRAATPKEKP